MSRRGGGGGGGGGGRKPGNHPLPPPPPDGGDKGGTTKPATAGWGDAERNPVGDGRRGCGRAFADPTLVRTPPSFPSHPLPEQLSFARPKTPGPVRSEETKPRGRSLPGSRRSICAEQEARVASPAPQPPPHSLSVPTHPVLPPAQRTLRPILAPRKQAWSPGVRCGGRGSKGTLRTAGGGRGDSEPTLLASSLLRSIRARVRDSIRDIICGGSPGGRGADPGVQLLWGEGGGGVRPARVGLGDRKSDSPRPAPSASSSNRVSSPASAQEGEAGRREGGCRRAGRDASGCAGQLGRAPGRRTGRGGPVPVSPPAPPGAL